MFLKILHETTLNREKFKKFFLFRKIYGIITPYLKQISIKVESDLYSRSMNE